MAYLLVVDDDADGRDALCQFLGKFGFEVKCVSNGKEALAAILDRMPDLVILDLYMPEMDGVTLLEIVRSYLRFQTLPVIVLTGVVNGLTERVRKLFVTAIMLKANATFEDILHAVRKGLDKPLPA